MKASDMFPERVHDFYESLENSHRHADLPLWGELYRAAFPTFQGMFAHSNDGEHQRAGVDRSVLLTNGKQILVDEKIRFKDYGDILLEYLSNKERNIPGWVCKPLRCDYIAYTVAPTGKGYLLPTIQLQEAWRRNKHLWMQDRYFTARAPNELNGQRWTTLSKAIPVVELFKAIGACLRVEFTPYVKPEKED